MEKVRLLDLAPTLLELAATTRFPTCRGGASFPRRPWSWTGDARLSSADQEIIRQRLSGLGYI